MLLEGNLLPVALIVVTAAVGEEGALRTPVKHSLIYYYTELTKDLTSLGFHEFTALGLLDDQTLYSYDSKNQVTVLQETWINEDKNVAYMLHSAEELQRLRSWFRKQNEILGNCTWPCPDLHVLQRRVGCEVQEHNGVVELLKAVEEYGYDGKDFITFDADAMQWKAEDPNADSIQKAWDKEKARMQRIKFYITNECVESLSNFLQLNSIRRKTVFSPDSKTTVFAIKSIKTITLTCLVTGVNTKDVVMSLRKVSTSLPENLLTSSGVRPNGDGTYQLRKSVEIHEGEKKYSCRIEHSSLDKPITVNWDGNCRGCEGHSRHLWLPLALASMIILLVIILLCFYQDNGDETADNNGTPLRPTDTSDQDNNVETADINGTPSQPTDKVEREDLLGLQKELDTA
ncbi:zinc-alpha-2-glycoprotein-like [Salminus brasiliensis]|uniref:zinc-alpha-2-glycoprotein-like n=1 Tax=Salminus brasiliensis TaxID=930266 RepID=UPI003B831E56